MGKGTDSAAPTAEKRWTRAEDYVAAMARRRTARRNRAAMPRTQPESPQLLLSTLPFLVLMTAMLVITVGIVSLAWPGTSQPTAQRPAVHEVGTAAKGWFQEAERDFHS